MLYKCSSKTCNLSFPTKCTTLHSTLQWNPRVLSDKLCSINCTESSLVNKFQPRNLPLRPLPSKIRICKNKMEVQDYYSPSKANKSSLNARKSLIPLDISFTRFNRTQFTGPSMLNLTHFTSWSSQYTINATSQVIRKKFHKFPQQQPNTNMYTQSSCSISRIKIENLKFNAWIKNLTPTALNSNAATFRKAYPDNCNSNSRVSAEWSSILPIIYRVFTN